MLSILVAIFSLVQSVIADENEKYSNYGEGNTCNLTEPAIDSTFGKLELEENIYCSDGAAPIEGFKAGINCCYPMTVAKIGLKLYIYLPAGNGTYKETLFNDTIGKTLLQKYSKVVYILHGSKGKPLSSPWVTLIRKYHNAENVPVIVADYSEGMLGSFPLRQAHANVRTIGKAVGHSLLTWDIVNRTLLIGFSLGATVIAEVSHYLSIRSSSKVKECHGIDPSGPFFDGGLDQAVLDKSDCDLVQVVHMAPQRSPKTPSESLKNGQRGTNRKCGHCDFWINCGHEQESCLPGIELNRMTGKLTDGGMDSSINTCSHIRAILIYIHQLYQECNFTGYLCKDCGVDFDTCSVKSFYYPNSIPPFSKCDGGMDINYVVSTTSSENVCRSYFYSTLDDPVPFKK